MKPDIEAIKKYWATVEPGCDDPEEVASKGMDDVPVLIKEVESEQRRLNQLEINFKFLMDAIDNIHFALEPDKSGTWQMRTQMAVAATHKLIKEIEALREKLSSIETEYKEVAEGMLKNALEMEALHTKSNEELKEKLALSEAAGASMVDVLRKHWITAIECDHKAKTDTVRCSCSIWTGTPQASVGLAVEQWVQHIQALASSHGKAFLDVVRAEAEMRRIIHEFVQGLNPFSRHEYAGEVAYEGKFKGSLVEAATKVLASDHGKAYLDLAEKAERFRRVKVDRERLIGSHIDLTRAELELFCAIDRLPGRGSETTNPGTTSY